MDNISSIKVVILAGGYGTRISEETDLIPKPLVKIDTNPILWHIMRHYSSYRLNNFIICAGYKSNKIIEYFFKISKNSIKLASVKKHFLDKGYFVFQTFQNWKVTVVNTGLDTMTGGRIKKIKRFVKNDEYFHLTYGDGISNVNFDNLLKIHLLNKCFATLTAVSQPNRFGLIKTKDNMITSFEEKPFNEKILINGGFFILSPKIFELIKNKSTIWERDPLQRLASMKQLFFYHHKSFWYSMDTLRDKRYLSKLALLKNPPWLIKNE